MPVYSRPFPSLPADTERAAKSVFNIENLYLAIGDRLDRLFDHINWDDLYAIDAKPAHNLFILAMVTIFQYAEDLPDHQAAEAIRTRMDWKYALHLSLDYPGFAPEELTEFRQRLLMDASAQRVFRHMLTRLGKLGLLGSREKREVDVTTVLKSLDALSRVERVAQAMTQALEALASAEPTWLRAVSLPHWYERYDPTLGALRLPHSLKEQEAMAQAIGADICHLLEVSAATDAPTMAPLPELQALRRIWHQEFSKN